MKKLAIVKYRYYSDYTFLLNRYTWNSASADTK